MMRLRPAYGVFPAITGAIAKRRRLSPGSFPGVSHRQSDPQIVKRAKRFGGEIYSWDEWGRTRPHVVSQG